jgi:serine/threonine protein kinase
VREHSSLGRYQILGRISIGGMAEVFRAKAVGHAGFEKLVALKCILPDLVNDREFVGMFIDEARTVAQLSHANICQIFEFGQAEDTYFIAMELIEGKDLKRIMEYHRLRGRPMPLPIALYVMSRTCEALDYAHAARGADGAPLNIVHRDVSPQNILVSWEGEVKLIDFGIAKAAVRTTRTEAGNVKGKFSYISPEQLAGDAATVRSDIFTCGIVLYELVTNCRLFRGETDMDTVERVRRCEVLPPSQLNPRLPGALDRILLRALSRDPAGRPASAGALLDELEEVAVARDSTCTGNQVARWMNDTFGQERQRTLQRHLVEDHIDTAEHVSPEEQHNIEDQVDTAEHVVPAVVLLSRPKGAASNLVVPPEASAPRGLDSVPTIQVGLTAPEPDGSMLAATEAAATTATTVPATPDAGQPAWRWLTAGAVAALIAVAALCVVFWPRGRRDTTFDPPPPPRVAPIAVSIPLDVGPTPDAHADAPLTGSKSDLAPRRPARPLAAASRPARAGTRAASIDAGAPAPRPDATAGRPGLLIVSSRPWARVWVDGKDTGRYTPVPRANPLELPPGNHRVGLQIGQQVFEYDVSIASGAVTKLIKDLTRVLDGGT